MSNLSGTISSILFASQQPVQFDRLCAFLDEDPENVKAALEDIGKSICGENSGISLECKGNSYFFTTKYEYGETVATFLEQRKTSFLSNAALETLAIAAYNQPVTKTFISQVRGVQSAEVVESLVDKNLLAENGHLDLPGRPMSYITTDRFLTVFGLRSLDDLPPQDKKLENEDVDLRIPTVTEEYAEEDMSSAGDND